ncbi:putative heat shock protein [Pseudoalteromonas luteoviolacea B = ATCC 29581]|nr:putative heat shock protein [Pseudoalteromonas luteoviolacea B = ATCC 29581]
MKLYAMNRFVFTFVFFALLCSLSGCNATPSVTENALKHTAWRLISVDGKSPTIATPVSLRFIDALQISGSSGCNRFFGEAQTTHDTLVIKNVGMTRKLCDEQSNALEHQLLTSMQNGIQAQFNGELLELNGEQVFVFKPVETDAR